jgi:hypothetical protein
MNINAIDTAARDIIASNGMTRVPSRARLYDMIADYCDDPATTRMTMHRIAVRITQHFN